MNMRVDIVLHGIIALAWISLALGMCLKLALLGNERASLARARGESLKSRTDLTCKQDRLRAILDQQTSPTALEEAARTLNPPMSAPFRPAFRPAPTAAVAAMSPSR
jgi:hypothetical protein